MFKLVKKEIEWGNRTLSLEFGKIARQADGAVLITYGQTSVLCTVVTDKEARPDVDFLPLSVHYREMAFAAGKIPGGFYKREGRASEKETLVSRLIDRPIRPLFSENFHHETQIICTVLSHDLINDSDIISIIGSAAALAISGVPFNGPLAAAKIGYKDEKFILNPTFSELANSKLDLVVAGTKDSVLMVESEAHELSEELMLEAIMLAHKEIQPIVDLINEIAQQYAKPLLVIESYNEHQDLVNQINTIAKDSLTIAYNEHQKASRYQKISAVEKEILAELTAKGFDSKHIRNAIKSVKQEIVRNNILVNNHRIDGRKNNEVRPIEAEVSLLAQTHGSALFTRGETQSLAVTTLGTAQDEQIIDNLEGDSREHFILHYNFPPYSVGEASQFKAPGRREIGHGRLAWRSIKNLLPSKAQFPYTIRVVSEITECNGSSSMASVCGASLSLMDAGVPLKCPVAGIAMGLIMNHDQFVILSDIMGDEDHLGDMDFKVAGTNDGITALQMDIKISGVTKEIMTMALDQARTGRIHILEQMSKSLVEYRTVLNKNAPVITSITINKDKIREVIGSGGSVIKKICELSGAKIDIDDEGIIKIAAINSKSSEIAAQMIHDIVLEPEIGKVYEGKVVKILEFGAFVNFLGSRDGLVHISELSEGRVNLVSDVVNEGESVKVVVLGVDNRGKVKLSMRLVNQVNGDVNDEALNNVESAKTNEGRSYNNRKSSRDPSKPDSEKKNTRYKDSREKTERKKFFH